MGIIKAMTSTMTRIHMDRILRSVRPPRHLIAERIEQTRAVADEERREREHALLRLAPRIHRVPSAADLPQQCIALALQARDQLLFDLLRAGQCRIARRLDRALERGIHRRDDPRQARVAHFDLDRKSTRLNSSHGYISYAVFC